jgi:hypothetical protein
MDNKAKIEEVLTPEGPKPVYGISLFVLENGETAVHVTGTPTMGRLYALLSERMAALSANITASAVLHAIEQRAAQMAAAQAATPNIIVPKLQVKPS